MDEIRCLVTIYGVADGRKLKVTFDEPVDASVLNDVSEYFRSQLDMMQLGSYEVVYNESDNDIKISRFISNSL